MGCLLSCSKGRCSLSLLTSYSIITLLVTNKRRAKCDSVFFHTFLFLGYSNNFLTNQNSYLSNICSLITMVSLDLVLVILASFTEGPSLSFSLWALLWPSTFTGPSFMGNNEFPQTLVQENFKTMNSLRKLRIFLNLSLQFAAVISNMLSILKSSRLGKLKGFFFTSPVR